jgi:cation diffusion facilitator family transporter
MAGSSKKAIYGAISANIAIAISKFVAAFFTGSASMFSEGVHSLVDTGNGALLLHGIRRSKKPPDTEHPYGYGQELFFWSFIVAILIFALGGGIAIYEGVKHLFHPRPMRNLGWNYLVLILAMVFEGSALRIALKEFNATRGTKSFYRALRESKDSATIAVVIEDTAALSGLAVAVLSVFLGQTTRWAYFDGIGSILIGLILVCVSFFFAAECKGLLVGEGLLPEDVEKLTGILEAEPSVRAFKRPLSLYFGPSEVLVNLEVDFRDALTVEEVEAIIDGIEGKIRAAVPVVKRIFIEAEKVRTKAKGTG